MVFWFLLQARNSRMGSVVVFVAIKKIQIFEEGGCQLL
jgi:hypothetical protein